MQLFEPEQQQQVYQQSVKLLNDLDDDNPHVSQAQQRLQDIATVMTAINQPSDK